MSGTDDSLTQTLNPVCTATYEYVEDIFLSAPGGGTAGCDLCEARFGMMSGIGRRKKLLTFDDELRQTLKVIQISKLSNTHSQHKNNNI